MIYIIEEPKNQSYVLMIELAVKICSNFSLTINKKLNIEKNCKKILEDLKPYFIKCEESIEDKDLIIYYYNCCNEVIPILTNSVNGLYEWIQPNYPEDICFYKNNYLWLYSVSYESQGSIECNDEEKILLKNIPGLHLEKFDVIEFIYQLELKGKIIKQQEYILERYDKKIEVKFSLPKEVFSKNITVKNQLIFFKYDTEVLLNSITYEKNDMYIELFIKTNISEKNNTGQFLDTRIINNFGEFIYGNEKFTFYDNNESIINLNYDYSMDLHRVFLTLDKNILENIESDLKIKFNGLNLYKFRKK